MALVSSAHMFGINQFTLHIYNFTVATEVLPQMQKLQAMPSKNSNIPSYAFQFAETKWHCWRTKENKIEIFRPCLHTKNVETTHILHKLL